jgi:hypothetical protein
MYKLIKNFFLFNLAHTMHNISKNMKKYFPMWWFSHCHLKKICSIEKKPVKDYNHKMHFICIWLLYFFIILLEQRIHLKDYLIKQSAEETFFLNIKFSVRRRLYYKSLCSLVHLACRNSFNWMSFMS